MASGAYEIERKFIPRQLPSLAQYICRQDERYFLYRGKGVELRLHRSGGKYYLQRKATLGNLSRNSGKLEISEDEFMTLKPEDAVVIKRKSYAKKELPGLGIKVYEGQFKGLVRVEMEFNSEEEARAYQPEDWMGVEITGSPIANDARLIDLSESRFHELLQKYSPS